jgi:hypothetical protein
MPEPTHLEDMTPVLALVVETLVEHLHDLHKVSSVKVLGVFAIYCAPLITHWLYVSWAISFICVPEGPQGSFDVAWRTLV